MTETETAVDSVSMAIVAIADGDTPTEAIQLDPFFTIEIECEEATRRRYRFEPRQECSGWWRYDDEWTGTRWECNDRECVRSVSLTVDGAPSSEYESDESSRHQFTGPLFVPGFAQVLFVRQTHYRHMAHEPRDAR